MRYLTDRQYDIVCFIKKHRDEKQYSPTYREIAENFNITVKGSFDHINAIKNKGYLSYTPKISRSIVLNKEKLEFDGLMK
jgi:repressor LexA